MLTLPPIRMDKRLANPVSASGGRSLARVASGDVSLTILEGSTFCICDEIGDLRAGGGLFADDTRFLSRFELIDRRCATAAALVRAGRVLLGCVLPAQPARLDLAQDTIAIARERFVGPGLTEVVRVRNVSMQPESRSS